MNVVARVGSARYKLGLWLLPLLSLSCLALWYALRKPFPSDHTPEGAYLRIAKSMSEGHVRDVFPYLETDAQWACFSIRDARKKMRDLVLAHYPEGEKTSTVQAWSEEAAAPDGSDVFVVLARKHGWEPRLRRDLSGIVNVEVQGERASITTARGTRYPFRRRDNGIWGLTLFTAELTQEREKAARDLAVIEASAADYARARAGR